VQTDKNALYTLNKDKGRFQNEIIGLNRDQTALSNAVDNKVIAELSQDGQLYRVKQTTNPKTGLQSAPHDLDKTFERAVLDRNGNRVWEDVPRDRPIHPTSDKTLKDLYGQKLDEVAQSRTTHPGQEGFRKAIDHEITDGRFAESYGFKAVDHRVAEVLDGSQDLDRLLNRVQVGTDAAGKPMYGTLDRTAEVLTDAEGVGRTISYKAEHWYGRADEARQAAVREMNAGNTVAAERHLAEASTRSVEGMRQTTKQLGNQLTPRWEAARNAVAEKLPVGRNIDEVMPLSRMNKLQEAADIMELGHKGGWPPSRVDELLQQQVGMSSRQVSEQVGQMVEALDTLRPVQGNIGATAPWGGLKVPPGTGAGLRTGIEGVAGSEPGSFFDLFGGEAS